MTRFVMIFGCMLSMASVIAGNPAGPKVSNVFAGNWISSMYSEEDGYEVEFIYNDEGQLLEMHTVACEDISDNVSFTFEYADGVHDGIGYNAVMTFRDFEEEARCYLTLNDMGFITKCIEEIDIFGFKFDVSYEIGYDDDGLMNYFRGDDTEFFIDRSVDGDISLVRQYWQWEDGSFPQETYIPIYTSDKVGSPIANISGLNDYYNGFRIDVVELAFAYYAGMLGKPTAHLPLGVKDGNGDIVSEIEWVIDPEGYPVMESATSYDYADDDTDRTMVSYRWKKPGSAAIPAIVHPSAEDQWYTVTGLRLPSPRKGINILKHSDGSVSKIIDNGSR